MPSIRHSHGSVSQKSNRRKTPLQHSRADNPFQWLSPSKEKSLASLEPMSRLVRSHYFAPAVTSRRMIWRHCERILKLRLLEAISVSNSLPLKSVPSKHDTSNGYRRTKLPLSSSCRWM